MWTCCNVDMCPLLDTCPMATGSWTQAISLMVPVNCNHLYFFLALLQLYIIFLQLLDCGTSFIEEKKKLNKL